MGPVRYLSLPLLPHLQNCCLILACASFFLPSFISSSMLSFHILEEKGIQSFYWASYCVSPFFPRQICLACHQTSSQCLFTPGGEIRIPGLLLKRDSLQTCWHYSLCLPSSCNPHAHSVFKAEPPFLPENRIIVPLQPFTWFSEASLGTKAFLSWYLIRLARVKTNFE